MDASFSKGVASLGKQTNRVIMKYLLVISLFFSISLFACGEEDFKDPCFDESLVHDDFCTADCPGVTGCDGKTYCNECEANRVGIRVED